MIISQRIFLQCLAPGRSRLRTPPRGYITVVLALYLLGWQPWAAAAIVVVDDSGKTLSFDRPVQRVVSLAPHLTENMFTVGAGERLVGVSQYSDYPESAKRIVRVGDYQAINIEKIIALQPDLVLAWSDGGATRALARLAQLGIPIYWSRPVTIDSIAHELSNLALLAGTQQQAGPVIQRFAADVARLQPARRLPPVRVFYQVWSKPLQTLSANSLIGDLIARCGGSNIFADIKAAVGQVDVESVLARDPELILGSHAAGSAPRWQQDWQQWPGLSAVADNQIYSVEADFLSRHSVRVLTGARQVCAHMRAAAGDATLP